jgi:hypothetical protein
MSLRTILAIAVYCTLAAGRATGSAAYGHRIHQFSEEHSRVSIYNRQTGHAIWQRSVGYIYQAAWSPDRRAFALMDDAPGSAESPFRLIVWRAGERVRSYRAIPPLPYLDTIDHVAWSSDNKRLLLLGGSTQGNGSVGLFDLWCLNVDLERTTKLTAYSDRVTKAQWIGPRRIWYWAVRSVKRHGRTEYVADKTPHVWMYP